MRSLRLAIPAVLLLLPFALRAQEEKLPPDDLAYVQKTWPHAKKTYTGIRYVIEREGTGLPPNAGDKVFVLYDGHLLHGKEFDAAKDPLKPFSFRVDRYAVIAGWDEMLETMKVGEKRLCIIPSQLAYGTRGQVPDIPPDATLVFEIELLRIERVE